MAIDEIIACILVVCMAFYGYMTWLRTTIDLMIAGKPTRWDDVLLYGRSFFLLFNFHVRYHLHDEYPQKEILKLSRRYDKLIPFFYGSFVVIPVVVLLMVWIRG
jgi:hypothetical protein